MVKKKKTRQPEPMAQIGGESTESGEENQVNLAVGTCPHVIKAIGLGKVKKALKGYGLAQECSDCLKSPSRLPSNDSTVELSRGLWLCLKCGNQGCGRFQQQHALHHHRIPHSDSHSLAVHTQDWKVWCYDCNVEVAVDCRKKLHECIKFLKQQDCPIPKPLKTSEETYELRMYDNYKPMMDLTNRIDKKTKPCIVTGVPKVRGLRNLGNTCYLNVIIQNLAHTPYFLEILLEMKEPGNPFQLPGNETGLPVIKGELGKWGVFTEILSETLDELRRGSAEIVNPEKLLQRLSQKNPNFSGADQQDSHELLRQLLDEIRNEDLKRYQAEILHNLGLRTSVDPSVVPDLLRNKVRLYGRQAAKLVLRPEQPFRGQLVSTLECQDCKHTSQHFESFLELSLPVVANKPQPPAVVRRKTNNEEVYDLSGKPSKEAKSKHQLKKERKVNKKGKKFTTRQFGAEHSEPVIVEEAVEKSKSRQAEETDADVEDNIDQDSLSHEKKNVVESGYSSEKAWNEDSTVDSPICLPSSGDTGLSNVDHEEVVLTSPEFEDEFFLASPECDEEIIVSTLDDDQAILAGLALKQEGNDGLKSSCVNCVRVPDNGTRYKNSVVRASTPVSNNELVMTISSLPNPPLGLGSPLSTPQTPSPVSSEVNLDCTSPASTQVLGDCTSPVSDPDRPVSRVSFWNDETLVRNWSTPMENSLSSSQIGVSTEITYSSMNHCEQSKCAMKSSKVNSNNTSYVGQIQNGVIDSEVRDCEVYRSKKYTGSSNVNLDCDDSNKSVAMAPRYSCEDDECSVLSCLNQFTVLELMTGNNKVVCENCTEHFNKGKDGKKVCTNSTKQYLVSIPPAVLILHFKRFDLSQTTLRKIGRHITFPMVLDLAPVCSTKCRDLPTLRADQTQVLYALYGVVEHSGTMNSGHYVAYVKVRPPLKSDDSRWSFLPCTRKEANMEETTAAAGGAVEPPPGKWFYVSDTRVLEVQEERVLRSQAYILFYERIW